MDFSACLDNSIAQKPLSVPLLAGSRFFGPTWKRRDHGSKNLDQTDRSEARSRGVRELRSQPNLMAVAGSSPS
jgi:hypothetical protein